METLNDTQLAGLKTLAKSEKFHASGVHHKTVQALKDKGLALINTKGLHKITAKGKKHVPAE